MKGRGMMLYAKLQTQLEADFVRITPIKSYSPGELSVATSEKTYVDQQTDDIDHSTGLTDPGEVAFGVEYDPANAGQILLEANLGKRLDFKCVWSDLSGVTYTGSLTKIGMSEPTEEDLMRNYSVKRSAKPVPFNAP